MEVVPSFLGERFFLCLDFSEKEKSGMRMRDCCSGEFQSNSLEGMDRGKNVFQDHVKSCLVCVRTEKNLHKDIFYDDGMNIQYSYYICNEINNYSKYTE